MNLYSTPGLDLFQLCKDTKTEQRKDKTRNAMPVEQCSVGVAAEGSKFWTYSEDTKEENMKLFCANRTGIMWLFMAAPQEPGTHKWSIISPVVSQPAAQVISLERVVFVSSCSTVCVHEHLSPLQDQRRLYVLSLLGLFFLSSILLHRTKVQTGQRSF